MDGSNPAICGHRKSGHFRRPETGAVASADFAGDHGGPDGLFGAPVGDAHRRVPQKGEDGGNSMARCAAKRSMSRHSPVRAPDQTASPVRKSGRQHVEQHRVRRSVRQRDRRCRHPQARASASRASCADRGSVSSRSTVATDASGDTTARTTRSAMPSATFGHGGRDAGEHRPRGRLGVECFDVAESARSEPTSELTAADRRALGSTRAARCAP